MEDIYPIFDQILSRSDKERELSQLGKVIWLIGLSGSGKSTLAKNLEKLLFKNGFFCQLLDGDNLRTGLNGDLRFSAEDRTENLRRTAEVAKLFANSGIVTIASFITPSAEARNQVKSIIGTEDYLEVFVNCPLEVCEERDVKGLYKKARAGEIPDFTGINAPFDAPENPDLELKTDLESLEYSLAKLFNFIRPQIAYKD